MADRIVMGYWDCKYCGTTGIEGIKRDCPNCGHPRDKDTKFYMKSRNHEEVVRSNDYLTEKQAAVKGKGPDWECSFCGALNSALSDSCKSCGHPREEADPNYFQVRAREEGEGAVIQTETPYSRADSDTNAFYHEPGAEDNFQEKPPVYTAAPDERKSFPWKKILLAAVILLALFGIIWGAVPHPKTLHVLHKSWEYSISVEEYRYVPDSGWDLPPGADLDRTNQEIHHYNSVLDHYETKTRTYQERVQTGSHTEYSYSDNGDGTFTEHSREVADYGYETRTETYQDPVYIQVPVYQTRYYYHLWRWEYARSVETSGTDNDPYYGEMNLSDKERENGRYEQYYLEAYEEKKTGSVKTFSISEYLWDQVQIGSDIRVLVQGSRITEFADP